MSRSWASIFTFCIAAIALVGIIALTFAYENLRRQMAGISSDMARLPNLSASHEHFEARLAVIKSQLSRVEKPIIVLGDSIVESALLPASLCGHPVINAGIGGATIGFFTRYASIIANDSNPALVVLSVGINDAGTNSPNLLERFRAAYLAALKSIRGPVALVTITPSKNAAIDTITVGQFNQFIKSLNGSAAIIDANNDLSDKMTIDGIHLNQVGYKIWSRTVVRGVEAKVGCSPTGG